MAELVVERPLDGDLRLGQWTLGLNSRGLSFGYQRDRRRLDGFDTVSSKEVLRIGTAASFRNGSIGGGLSFHRGGGLFTQRGLDVGVRVRPLPPLDLGGVVRNIGRPAVRGERLPVAGILAVSWTPLAAQVQISAESRFAERLSASGYAVTHRAGARLATRGRFPVAAVVALNLGGNLKIDRWTVGMSVGGRDQVVVLGSAFSTDGRPRFDTFSLTGVASRRATGRGF
jgi:hypothetical protein